MMFMRFAIHHGEVPERLNGPVSKTGDAFGCPWVRIPPSPLAENDRCEAGSNPGKPRK